MRGWKRGKVMDNKKDLLGQLAQFGYALIVPETHAASPEKVLEALLKQDDVRLLEGFPVVLANALAQKNALAWEKNEWRPGKAFSEKTKERWTALMAVSVFLFRLFGAVKEAQDRVLKLLKKDPEANKILDSLEKDLSGQGEVNADGLRFSVERLKTAFRNYVVQQSGFGEKAREQKDALERELLLSAVFTQRQKELLAKKLAGTPLSKTEREYYYRVVKKRLKVLADSRLYQMARDLVYA